MAAQEIVLYAQNPAPLRKRSNTAVSDASPSQPANRKQRQFLAAQLPWENSYD